MIPLDRYLSSNIYFLQVLPAFLTPEIVCLCMQCEFLGCRDRQLHAYIASTTKPLWAELLLLLVQIVQNFKLMDQTLKAFEPKG